MKRFKLRHLVTALCAAGSLSITMSAFAAAFQIWEQDGASIGNYHAGYAVLAQDASIAFYNPAGIVRFKNQQIVLGGAAVLTDFKYKGSVAVSETTPGGTFTANYPSVTAQGGTLSAVPSMHYVTPINDYMGFGFSVVVPFGLKTDYGSSTPLRYAATLTSITVIDISPSLGFKVTDKGSLGIGLDIQKAYGEFDLTGTLQPLLIDLEANSVNKANDTGYGFHLGGMYEFSEATRVGLSYHSQVVHHMSGPSEFTGGIPTVVNADGSPTIYSRAKTNVTLPAYTAFSAYHKIMPQVALMGSVIYTQWKGFRNLIFNNIAGVVNDPSTLIKATNDIQVVIPEHFKNTWNVSVGADYYATDDITLRGGVGYDQSPISNTYRNVQLPDNNRYVIAFGGHYQATKAWGFDLGWTHLFIHKANVNPPPLTVGGQTVATNGSVTGGADVFGAQVSWTIT